MPSEWHLCHWFQLLTAPSPTAIWPSASVSGTNLSAPVPVTFSISANCGNGDLLQTTGVSSTPGCPQSITVNVSDPSTLQALIQSLTFSAGTSNDIPPSAPRRVAITVAGSLPIEVSFSVTPVNTPAVWWGTDGVQNQTTLNISEGSPADVWLVVASPGMCSSLTGQQGMGGMGGGMQAPVLCYEDSDPRVGLAVNGSASIDSFLSISTLSSSYRDTLGMATRLLSVYTLTASNAAAAPSCALTIAAAAIPGTIGLSCTDFTQGGAQFDAREVTTPPGTSPWAPHTPFGWRPTASSASSSRTLDGPCFMQRYRLLFGSRSSSTGLQVGCGLPWGVSAAGQCSLDYEAAYCNAASQSTPPGPPTFRIAFTLNDTLVLDPAAPLTHLTAPVFLNLTINDVFEPPVVAWADAATLSALCTSCQASANKSIALDDLTGIAVPSFQPALALPLNFTMAPLLVCSQEAPTSEQNFSLLLSVPLPSELLQAVNVTPAVHLPLQQAPACASAFATSAVGLVSAGNTTTSSATLSWVWVQAFTLQLLPGLPPDTLTQVPLRDFVVSASSPLPSPTGAALAAGNVSALLVPIHITRLRSTQGVTWTPAGPFTLMLAENTLPSTLSFGPFNATSSIAAEELEFSLGSLALVNCTSAAGFTAPNGGVPSSFWPADMFALQQITATSVNLSLAVDALDIDSAASALGAFPAASCQFSLSLYARGAGNVSALPLIPFRQAVLSLTLVVSNDAGDDNPVITTVLGLSSAVLNPAGGQTIQLAGTGLGLPAGPSSVLNFSLSSTATGLSVSTACTVLVRNALLNCIMPAGWGRNLDAQLLVGGAARSSGGYALPTARNGTLLSYADPQVLLTLQPLLGSLATVAWRVANGSAALNASYLGILAQNIPPPSSRFSLSVSLLASAGAPGSTLLSATPSSILSTLSLPYCATVPLNATSYPPVMPSGGTFKNASSLLASICSRMASSTDAVSLTPLLKAPQPGVYLACVICDLPQLYSGGLSVSLSLSPSSTTLLPSLAPLPGDVPRLAFLPTISRVLQNCTSASLCGTFLILGDNLGTAVGGASWQASMALSGFDSVEYVAGNPSQLDWPARCAAFSTPSGLQNSSCAIHTAVNCTYVHPQTAIACELDPSGWGTAFRVRVTVQGVASPWSTDTLSYPAPQLVSANVTWAFGAPGGPSLFTTLHPSGGSLLRITGYGLSPLSQLVLTLGGVVIPQPYFSSYASVQAVGATGAPPSSTLSGTAAPLAGLRYSPLQSIVICIPPGLGTVQLTATVGALSASLSTTYSPPILEKPFNGDPLSLTESAIRFSLPLLALSPCIACLSSWRSVFPECGSGSSSGITASPLPGSTSCPTVAGVSPFPGAHACALPDSLWSWSAVGYASPTNGPPPLLPLQASASLTISRVLTTASQVDPFVLSLGCDSVGGTVTYSNGTLAPNGGVLQVSSTLKTCTLALRVQVGSTYQPDACPAAPPSAPGLPCLYAPQTSLNQFDLFSISPQVTSMSSAEWLPAGNELVTLTAINAASYGLVIVSPSSAVLNSNVSQLLPSTFQCASQTLVAPPTAPSTLGWSAGPIICPITWDTDYILDSGVTVKAGLSNLARVVRLLRPYRECDGSDVIDKSLRTSSCLSTSQGVIDLISSTNLSSRLVYMACDPGYWLELPAVPCRLVQWQGSTKWQGGAQGGQNRPALELKFSTPSWVGDVSVTISSSQQFSLTSLPASYMRPTVSSIAPPPPLDTQGGVITVSGANFGLYPSHGSMWTRSGAMYLGSRASLNDTYGPHRVLLSYSGTSESSPRYCTVLSWNDTSITCKAPEGVAGSKNSVGVIHNISVTPQSYGNGSVSSYQSIALSWGWDSVQSAVTAQAEYSFGAQSSPESPDWRGVPSLTSVYPASGPTDGGYLAVLQGRSLSRLVIPNSTLRATNFSQLSNFVVGQQPAPSVLLSAYSDQGPTPDASSGGFWRSSVSLSGYSPTLPSEVTGLVAGAADTRFEPSSPVFPTVLFHNHTQVIVRMPPVEGRVWLSLTLENSNGDQPSVDGSTSPQPVQLTSQPPYITSIAALPVSSDDYDADPCAALASPTEQQCLTSARQVHDFTGCNSTLYNVSSAQSLLLCPTLPSSPCIRANGTRGSVTQLLIRGGNFGSGNWRSEEGTLATSVNLIPYSPWMRGNASQRAWNSSLVTEYLNEQLRSSSKLLVPCLPIAGTTGNVWKTSSAITCSISQPLRRGHWDVIVQAAFATTLSSLYSITPLAACGCGSFAENDGDYCLTCPAGASCAGALDIARPLFGVWKTDPTEWGTRRSLPLVTVDRNDWSYIDPRFIHAGVNWSVKLFVPCAVTALCLANQTCQPGTSGWMCLDCPAKAVRMEEGCLPCDESLVRGFWGTLLGSITLLGLLYFFGRSILYFLYVRAIAAFARATGCCSRALQSNSSPAAESASPAAKAEAAPLSPATAYQKVPYIKVLVSYFQTLAALAVYSGNSGVGTGSLSQQIKALIPPILLTFKPLADLGTSFAAVKCAFPVSTTDNIWLQLFLPLLAGAGGFLGYYASYYTIEFLTRLRTRITMATFKEVSAHSKRLLKSSRSFMVQGLSRRRLATSAPQEEPSQNEHVPQQNASELVSEDHQELGQLPNSPSTSNATAQEPDPPQQSASELVSEDYQEHEQLPNAPSTPIATAPAPDPPQQNASELVSEDHQEREQPTNAPSTPNATAQAPEPPAALLPLFSDYLSVTTTEQIDKAALATAFSLFLSLPICVRYLAQAQDCADPPLGFYLVMDPFVSCADDKFLNLQYAALFIGYFYTLLPLLAAAMLYNKYGPALRYGKFLTEGFRVGDNWARCWECLVLVRKIVFLGLSTGFLGFRDSRSQLLITTCLLAVAVGTQISTAPFASLELNLLDTLALSSEFLFAFDILPRQTGGVGVKVLTASGVSSQGKIDPSAGNVKGQGFTLGQINPNEQAVFDLMALAGLFVFLGMWVFLFMDSFVQGRNLKALRERLAVLTTYFASKEMKDEVEKFRAEREARERAEAERAQREAEEVLRITAAVLEEIPVEVEEEEEEEEEEQEEQEEQEEKLSPEELAEELAAAAAAAAAARARERDDKFNAHFSHSALLTRHAPGDAWYRIPDPDGLTLWRNYTSNALLELLPYDGSVTTEGWRRWLHKDGESMQRFWYHASNPVDTSWDAPPLEAWPPSLDKAEVLEPEPEPEAEPDTQQEPEPDTQLEAEPDMQLDAEPDTQLEAEGTQLEAEAVSEAVVEEAVAEQPEAAETEAGAVAEAEAEAGTEGETEAVAEAVAEAGTLLPGAIEESGSKAVEMQPQQPQQQQQAQHQQQHQTLLPPRAASGPPPRAPTPHLLPLFYYLPNTYSLLPSVSSSAWVWVRASTGCASASPPLSGARLCHPAGWEVLHHPTPHPAPLDDGAPPLPPRYFFFNTSTRTSLWSLPERLRSVLGVNSFLSSPATPLWRRVVGANHSTWWACDTGFGAVDLPLGSLTSDGWLCISDSEAPEDGGGSGNGNGEVRFLDIRSGRLQWSPPDFPSERAALLPHPQNGVWGVRKRPGRYGQRVWTRLDVQQQQQEESEDAVEHHHPPPGSATVGGWLCVAEPSLHEQHSGMLLAFFNPATGEVMRQPPPGSGEEHYTGSSRASAVALAPVGEALRALTPTTDSAFATEPPALSAHSDWHRHVNAAGIRGWKDFVSGHEVGELPHGTEVGGWRVDIDQEGHPLYVRLPLPGAPAEEVPRILRYVPDELEIAPDITLLSPRQSRVAEVTQRERAAREQAIVLAAAAAAVEEAREVQQQLQLQRQLTGLQDEHRHEQLVTKVLAAAMQQPAPLAVHVPPEAPVPADARGDPWLRTIHPLGYRRWQHSGSGECVDELPQGALVRASRAHPLWRVDYPAPRLHKFGRLDPTLGRWTWLPYVPQEFEEFAVAEGGEGDGSVLEVRSVSPNLHESAGVVVGINPMYTAAAAAAAKAAAEAAAMAAAGGAAWEYRPVGALQLDWKWVCGAVALDEPPVGSRLQKSSKHPVWVVRANVKGGVQYGRALEGGSMAWQTSMPPEFKAVRERALQYETNPLRRQ